jgi:DNA-binding GntR family transcriptional regulator
LKTSSLSPLKNKKVVTPTSFSTKGIDIYLFMLFYFITIYIMYTLAYSYKTKMAKEELEEYAYRKIIRMIIDNRYNPGDFLLETELSEELGYSRTPVRQALSRLMTEGFLEKKKKKGYFIPVPTPEDAKNVFFTREIIEGKTAAAAALNASDWEILELKELLKGQGNTIENTEKENYSLINEKFHLGIAKMSKNPYLERYCRHIFWRSNVYIFFFDKYYANKMLKNEVHETPNQHLNILNAIEQKDSESAEFYMKQHIRNSYQMLFGIPE